MKILKFFESKKRYREVDLTELWFYYCKYFDSPKITKFIEEVEILLIGEKIKFHRAKNPIDDKITYGFKGVVTDIQYKILSVNAFSILTRLENNKRQFFLATLKFNKEVGDENIIRIYNSEKTVFEKEMELFKNTEKYNL